MTGRWLLLGGVLAACSPAPQTAHGDLSRATHASPAATPSTDPYCAVQLPQSWAGALARHQVPQQPGEALVPFAVGSDGDRVFATARTSDWHGIVGIDLPAGARTRIKTFPSDQDQVGQGSFDGRWLMWTESHSFRNPFFDWSLHAWDSVSNSVIDLARPELEDGKPIAGQVVWPALEHGIVVWSQSTPQATAVLHYYQLATRRDRILDAGQLAMPVFAWPLIVWQYTTNNQLPRTLKVASAETGELEVTPEGLTDAHNPRVLGGAPGIVVWTAEDYRTLWLWRQGQAKATEIARVGEGEAIQFPSLAGSLIAWRGVRATFVVDTRSGAMTQVTAHYGFPIAQGHMLVVAAPSSETKVVHSQLTDSAVPVSELPPLPRCAR